MTTFAKWRDPKVNKAMGIELECLIPISCAFHVEDSYHGFFYTTYDGSIRGGGMEIVGREIVSQPLPKEWLKKEIHKLWKKGRWTHNSSCGIHVHVSRRYCGPTRAMKIARMLTTFSDQEMKLLFGREPNSYCHNVVDQYEKYQAVNFLHPLTIEFRMFSSGDAQWACYCLDMVDKLIRYRGKPDFNSFLEFATK